MASLNWARTARIGLFGALVALGATAACSDDKGGGGGSGGSAGDDAGTGGDGSGGETGDGGTPGTGGTGSGGDDAGAGGSDAGTGGASDGGASEGGDAEQPLTFWEDGVTGGGLSATTKDRLWTPVFDDDNNLFATGYVETAERDSKLVLVKIDTATGGLDTSWGNNGVVEQNHSTALATEPNPIEEGRDVVVQGDKLVVLGRAESEGDAGNTVIVVYRFDKATGALDETFGGFDITIGPDGLPASAPRTGHKTVIDLGDGSDTPWSLDIDDEDRLVIFAMGQSIAGLGVDGGVRESHQDRFVIRLTPDGDIDDTFGNGGIVSFDLPATSFANPIENTSYLGLDDNLRHGFVLPDGSIISAGYTQVGGRNQVVLIKLTEDGERDTTFSGDGVLRFAPLPLGMAEAYGVAIQQNGSFVTTGYGRVDLEANTSLEMVSFRVTADGTFDGTWGANGVVAYDISNGEERGRYTLALPDNRVLMFGAGTLSAGDKDAMLLLLNADGSVAEDFDPTGRKLYNYDDVNDEFFGGALSPDGTLVAGVGYSGTKGDATIVVVPVPQ